MTVSRPVRLVPQAAQPIEFSCPLCSSVHAAYVFGTDQFRICRCAGCALTFSDVRFLARHPSTESRRSSVRSEKQHSELTASLASESVNGQVLIVADPDDGIVSLLQRRNIAIGRIAGRDDFGAVDWDERYQAAVVSDALMRVSDPRAALKKIRKHLDADAPILVSVPLLDGHQARLMGRAWHEWQPGNLWYFSRETLNLLLLSSGFERVSFQSEQRRYSLDYLAERTQGIGEGTLWARSLKLARRVSPAGIRNRGFPLPSGTAVITARAAVARQDCVVSIVVPVFNEQATFATMMDALLAKQLPGMRKEIIVVESNSTDGSRELVQTYAGHPDVKVLLQSAPRGKGHAVREGLEAATGDILMIQDADLEYDLDDYEGLLEPLVAWQSMFVLGSRHQGGWKMRKFTDEPLTAAVFNFGHGFFRSLINGVLRTHIADPFTMYKVFRRDALSGLPFICNRFDFDIELVIKLVRKGYVPLEIPVNYSSRSFAEGKKVRVVRDGMTWVWTILRARFSSIESRRDGRG
jgi:hypothetical protein